METFRLNTEQRPVAEISNSREKGLPSLSAGEWRLSRGATQGCDLGEGACVSSRARSVFFKPSPRHFNYNQQSLSFCSPPLPCDS
ncbi:hypothetical protein PR048_027265 [Dryococelus australis]|uniref:Uncharacterized protein n=1 Tax=Dryococelus australis TaxID=614101 RepID=A0ABQ9GF66_9NEOP|nr:hypothetical protein PR048_027265 [Dryococelus australis]